MYNAYSHTLIRRKSVCPKSNLTCQKTVSPLGTKVGCQICCVFKKNRKCKNIFIYIKKKHAEQKFFSPGRNCPTFFLFFSGQERRNVLDVCCSTCAEPLLGWPGQRHGEKRAIKSWQIKSFKIKSLKIKRWKVGCRPAFVSFSLLLRGIFFPPIGVCWVIAPPHPTLCSGEQWSH